MAIWVKRLVPAAIILLIILQIFQPSTPNFPGRTKTRNRGNSGRILATTAIPIARSGSAGISPNGLVTTHSKAKDPERNVRTSEGKGICRWLLRSAPSQGQADDGG
jgi:hypothetical protein